MISSNGRDIKRHLQPARNPSHRRGFSPTLPPVAGPANGQPSDRDRTPQQLRIKRRQPQLDPAHLADLRKSGLSDATIQAADLYSYNSHELVFPYHGEPDHFERVKFFPPKTGADGTQQKYSQPSKSGARLYVPPEVEPLLQTNAPLFWAEGEKKALAMTQDGFPAVAIGGIHMFPYGDDPACEAFYGRITCEGRYMEIVPDSDVWKRQELLLGVYRLGHELESRGAEVLVVKLPAGKGSKCGYDDLPHDTRAELLPQLPTVFLSDRIFSKVARQEKALADGTSQAALSKHIMSLDAWQQLMYERNRHQWLRYDATVGIWRVIAEETIRAQLTADLDMICEENYSAGTLSGVLTMLETRLLDTLPIRDGDWLPFPNGALHVPTRTLYAHDPQLGFTWVLPYDYDPNATCEPIIDFLTEAMNGELKAVSVLRSYLRAVLLRRVGVQKFLELIGPGGSGKGTYTRLAEGLVGRENCHITKLSLLERSNFELINCLDKSLVLVSEAEHFRSSAEVLKGLTGQDTMRGEDKFEKPITFVNEAMIIISANEAIQWPDHTSGLARRRISVGFRHPPRIKRDLLTFHPVTREPEGELASYLPGLLNWVLDISENSMLLDLAESPSLNLLDERIRGMIADNSIANWANEWLVAQESPEVKTPIGNAVKASYGYGYAGDKDKLYPSYCGFCDDEGIKQKIGKNRFSDLLEDLCRHQLNLAYVYKKREKEGVFLYGLKLRKAEADRTEGFLYTHLAPQPREGKPLNPRKFVTKAQIEARHLQRKP